MSKSLSINTLNDVIVPKVKNIFILVPGTTDPVNSFANIQHDPKKKNRLGFDETSHRANSYKSKSMYWDDKFYQDMKDLEKADKNIIVFDKFGWSGDNCVSNRETAGKYLVRRLCMKDKYNAQGYYEPIKDKLVYFHFIGHSHGGNVINEMTKEMDKLSQWPEKWKVKSIIYLSTPFFNNLHQVKVTEDIFHKEAKILHVYNDYDLTQNFLADFSLFDLSLIDSILKDKKVLSIREKAPTNKPDEKGKIIGEPGFIDKCIDAYKAIPTDKFTDLWLSHDEGEILYDRTIEFLTSVENIFSFRNDKTKKEEGLFEVLKELNKEIEYNVSDFLKETIPKGLLKTKRQILKDDVYQELLSALEEILEGIRALKAVFIETKRTVDEEDASYSRKGYIDDLNGSKQLIDTLTAFLDIDEGSLVSSRSNSLWNILFKILDHNIDQFDNTYVDPIVQFQGTFLQDRLEVLDVTKEDEYDKRTAQTDPEGKITQAIILSNTTPMFGMQQQMKDIMNPAIFSKRYYTLLDKIKELETNYEGNPDQTNLMKILFTLIAHSPVHTLIDKWANTGIWIAEVMMNNEVEQSLDRFKQTMNKLKRVFNKNFVGNLEAFNMNIFEHFFVTSHSVSREKLHTEVKNFINKMKEN